MKLREQLRVIKYTQPLTIVTDDNEFQTHKGALECETDKLFLLEYNVVGVTPDVNRNTLAIEVKETQLRIPNL